MNSYLLFKSLHLIAVISWMSGLLYLPRIFVYHVENIEKKQATEIFEVMERRLYFYIMRPAMILTWLFGIILIYLNGVEIFSQLWIQLKIILVPIAFVSEHSETLVELDIEYKELADKNGCKNYTRVPALGTNENFIKAMSNLIINKQNYNYNGKLFPPKIQCPNQFKKCPCLNYE